MAVNKFTGSESVNKFSVFAAEMCKTHSLYFNDFCDASPADMLFIIFSGTWGICPVMFSSG